MKMIIRTISIGCILLAAIAIGDGLFIGGIVIKEAQARIGRPLTPVSVAGVGRRTVRRCAVGVYNCRLPGPQSLDSLLGQKSSESIRFPG
jgi:hypothetical protein